MNSLALLARRYDARALSSFASTSRAPASSSDALSTRPPRRAFQPPVPVAGPAHATRAAPLPAAPSTRLSSPLMDVTTPMLSIPSSSTPATMKARNKFIAQCYAVLRRAMQEALVWALPTAARAVQRVQMDRGDKLDAAEDTGSEDGGETMLGGVGDPHGHTVLADAALLSRVTTIKLETSASLVEQDERPPDPASVPPAVVHVTPPTPVEETAARSLATSFGIPPLRLFQPTSSTPTSSSQSLLPNPFSMSLLTSSPVPVTVDRKSSTRTSAFPPKKTLVLDLDETLIHSTSRPLSSSTGGTGVLGLGGLFGKRSQGPGHMVEVILNGRSTLYHVYKRPFVDYFLRKVSGWYTLVIFTASMQEYADPVIDWLDGGRGLFARRFFRESCTQQQGGSYSKDLALVDEDLSRICLIDNSPISYSNHPANGIPIEGWISDPSDEALLDLLPVLDSLRFATDVRRILGIRGF